MNTKKRSVDKVTLIGFITLAVILAGIFGTWYLVNYFNNKPITIKAGAEIAKVGDLVIDSDIYSYYFFDLKGRKEQEQQLTDAKARNSYWAGQTIENKPAMDWLKSQALETSRQHVLMVDKASKEGIQVTEEEKAKAKTDLDAQLKEAFGEESKYDAEIQKLYHISLVSFRKVMDDTKTIQKYYQESTEKVSQKITDSEIEKYYDKNPKEFIKAQVRHILFMSVDDKGQPFTKEKKEEVKKKAEAMLDRVNEGENMEKLAIKYSEDTGIKDTPDGKKGNKGIYDVEYSSQLVDTFKDFALTKPVNATGIVESTYGYHVMKVLKSDKTKFADAKKTIKETLSQTDIGTEIEKYLKDAGEAKVSNENIILQLIDVSLRD